MPLNGLLHLQYAQHVSGTFMPIIRSLRLYASYFCLWCAMPWLLVVRGQVQGSRLCVRDERCFLTGQSRNIPHPRRIACCPAPDLRPPATKALHTMGGNNTQSRAPDDGHKSARNMLSIL